MGSKTRLCGLRGREAQLPRERVARKFTVSKEQESLFQS